jgi:hypothetical protein
MFIHLDTNHTQCCLAWNFGDVAPANHLFYGLTILFEGTVHSVHTLLRDSTVLPTLLISVIIDID